MTCTGTSWDLWVVYPLSLKDLPFRTSWVLMTFPLGLTDSVQRKLLYSTNMRRSSIDHSLNALSVVLIWYKILHTLCSLKYIFPLYPPIYQYSSLSLRLLVADAKTISYYLKIYPTRFILGDCLFNCQVDTTSNHLRKKSQGKFDSLYQFDLCAYQWDIILTVLIYVGMPSLKIGDWPWF